MKTKATKPASNKAVPAVEKTVEKRSVSAAPELFAAADELMVGQRITNFSEYVRILIRRDLDEKAMKAQAA